MSKSQNFGLEPGHDSSNNELQSGSDLLTTIYAHQGVLAEIANDEGRNPAQHLAKTFIVIVQRFATFLNVSGLNVEADDLANELRAAFSDPEHNTLNEILLRMMNPKATSTSDTADIQLIDRKKGDGLLDRLTSKQFLRAKVIMAVKGSNQHKFDDLVDFVLTAYTGSFTRHQFSPLQSDPPKIVITRAVVYDYLVSRFCTPALVKSIAEAHGRPEAKTLEEKVFNIIKDSVLEP